MSARTIIEAFRTTVASAPDRVAVRTIDNAVSLTWGALATRVDALAGGLARLGVQRGHTVAIMLSNRPEFHLADLAAMTLGATPFSIYQTLSPEQIEYVVGDAGARVVIVEPAFLPAILTARRNLPQLEHVIVVDGEGGTTTLAEVEGSNPGFDAVAAGNAVAPDDLLTLIYTSGTTGPPKGVQLTHRNLIACAEALQTIVRFPEGARVISWLPAAHIAERAAHHYVPIVFGFTITCCPNAKEVVALLPQVRPNWFFAVPRIWEKIKAGLEARLAGLPDEQRTKAQAALAAAVQKVQLEQDGKPVPPALAEQVAAADAALFSMLRTMLGLDQAVAVNVGAAPTPRDVLEFFHAIGVRLGELWGMSETSGAGTTNPPERIKLGTVGPPIPGVELRLGDDGEVFIRGDVVMAGYRNQPGKTAETIDADGWLATGDVGQIDADGYLRIVDRKKEQEHVAGEHRGHAQGRQLAHRPVRRHRRRAAVQHGTHRARRRFRAGVGGAARARRSHARATRHRAGDDRGGDGGRRARQPAPGPRRAGEEVPHRARRLAGGWRRADADDEAQAQADRREVRARDRGDVRRQVGRLTG